jgi:hypothetical protein
MSNPHQPPGGATPEAWLAYYHTAEKRRRQAGWHRRSESRPRREPLGPTKVVAIVMALAACMVLLTIILPA